MYNKLEDSVLAYKRSVAELKQQMISAGAKNALMSGSGASVFALLDDEDKAKEIVKEISTAHRTVFLTHFWRT